MATKKAARSEELPAALLSPYVYYLPMGADRSLLSELPPPAPTLCQPVRKAIIFLLHDVVTHSKIPEVCQAITTHCYSTTQASFPMRLLKNLHM
jgi:hypothetical protein